MLLIRIVIDKNKESKKLSVLWVDDYPSNNAFIIDQFMKDGIHVKLSLTTEDGIKQLNDNKFDLVITDLGRKENGVSKPFAGLDLIKQMRGSNQTIPIIVFAGPRGLENKERLTRAGANLVTVSWVEIQNFVNSLTK
jgi:CheY-like chemotaxis protein